MPFVKGQSGNPGGRKKRDWTWGQVLEEVGEEIEPKTGKKYRELVSKRVWIEAVNGNLIAAKELFNRMDGLPHQDINLGGQNTEPIKITIIEDKNEGIDKNSS